ncbi:ATP-grasp domain-containing protein [Miniphocaeibacter halophilus]|uniref:ATP-grasp domain-containing protein n=1 Tax=Miniphocaeibacter halophilus TaxID=2931922 RepID=A0AC61MRS5_9FIRM|nr:ATP-grasp domain-containing protein [Miniphocaeibacter halophilus]QQK08196.1 ATP-grasp domain-containing protein [Miniphocaeibacter halophilus]
MNFVFISPHFPSNFENFIVRLRENGVNVLGIADEQYNNLSENLKANLTEYYRVNDLENYGEVLRACGYFTHKYGKIDRIESHNEHWLELDAKLRTDFNVFGFHNKDMDKIKRKSEMKKVFKECNIPVAKGRVFTDHEDAIKLAKELGYPVCIKPDCGVGANDTHKIHNEDELMAFYSVKHDVDYIMEEFIDGDIVTYDGLTDQNGNTVFNSTLLYDKAVLEIAEFDTDMYYYIPREIPEDLIEYGELCIKAFNVFERFFHIEFFREKDTGKLIALEINCRPPGGSTTDMFNYANDIDVYKEYANIVTHNTFEAKITRPYYCCYISRKDRNYLNSVDDIIEKYYDYIVDIQSIPGIFSTIMGNYGFIIRTPEKDKLSEIIQAISIERS